MIRQSSLAFLGLILSTFLAAGQETQSLGDVARANKAQKQAARNTTANSSSSKPTATPAGNTGAAVSQPAAIAATAAASTEPEIVPDLNPNVATDIHGIEKYEAAIRQLLQQEKFTEIDRLAAEARTTKARFAGGYWKVHTIYLALAEPGKASAGEAEWTQQLAHLEKWKEQFPASITARIALAEAYNFYGVKARGVGFADQVTDEGWRLLAERAHKGQVILEEAESLPEKCPEWYAAMIEIARSEDWEQDQLQALFQKAVAFEPDYYYYYRMLADSLLPKWGGEEGDSARFAAAVADGIGGKKGDLIYYEIATTLVCACDNVHGLNGLSWPRIKAGYSALQELYGTSISHRNEIAMMAFRAADFDYATVAFSEIGDNWDKGVWPTRDAFYNFKYQATIPRIKISLAAAKENVMTPEGQLFSHALVAEMEKRYHQPFLDCVKASPGYTQPWVGMLVELTKEGAVRDVLFSEPNAPRGCIRPLLEKAILPSPPKPDYWVLVQMDVKQ